MARELFHTRYLRRPYARILRTHALAREPNDRCYNGKKSPGQLARRIWSGERGKMARERIFNL